MSWWHVFGSGTMARAGPDSQQHLENVRRKDAFPSHNDEQ